MKAIITDSNLVIELCKMVKILLVATLLVISLSQLIADNVSFRDVSLRGYENFMPKFDKLIESSNSLKDTLPDGVSYDALDLSGGIIPVLYEDAVTDLEELGGLSLIDDGIIEIRPGAFKNLASIRRINLKKNSLKEIKTNAFSGLPVEDLDLSENLLEHIDEDAFDNLPNLVSINLEHNKLREWNKDWFKENPSLKRITFQYNLLRTLPARAFQSLEHDKRSKEARSRLYLNFAHNNIESLSPGVFEGVSEIKYLWLDNNWLETFDEGLLDGIKVNNLLLHDNNIKCLTGDFDKILVAETTSLDLNPWNCTCLNRLNEWKRSTEKIVVTTYANMQCKLEILDKKLRKIEDMRMTVESVIH